MQTRPIEILLSEGQLEDVGTQVHSVISDAIEKARSDAGMDKMFFNKKETCIYLGISNNTFDKYFIELKSHNVNGLIVYSKKDIDEFVLNK